MLSKMFQEGVYGTAIPIQAFGRECNDFRISFISVFAELYQGLSIFISLKSRIKSIKFIVYFWNEFST
jgi:hypothetical protein